MAKSQSEASSYPSRYAPGTWVTPAQFLAEYVCGRQAAAEGRELPHHFWKTVPGWEKKYLAQLRAANGLLKLYSPKAVSLALRSKEGLKILSLRAPWLDDLVKAEQRKLDAAAKAQAERPSEPPPPPPATPLPLTRPPFVPRKSVLDKLRELD